MMVRCIRANRQQQKRKLLIPIMFIPYRRRAEPSTRVIDHDLSKNLRWALVQREATARSVMVLLRRSRICDSYMYQQDRSATGALLGIPHRRFAH